MIIENPAEHLRFNGLQPLTIFAKTIIYMFDEGPEYISEIYFS